MIGRSLLVTVALTALPFSSFAQAGQDQPQQAPLDAGKEDTGRVSIIDGNGAIYGRGPYDEETWELSVNAVVRDGDELSTDDGAYAELELPGQTFVRLDGDTSIVLQRVGQDSIVLSLARGSLYVSRGTGAQPVTVQTFGGDVELGGNSMARVGGDERHAQIDVKVAKGSAEMRADKTSIAVAQGKTLVWTKTGSRNEAFEAARYDDFDRWNQTRENTVRGYTYSSNVSSAAMGSYELEGNGTWVMIDGYSAWQPTVVVADWRPYSYGHWSWCEPWGWTWVDDYRWGYTTSHYGRWYHRNHYGWVWYPDAYWGASWVVWAAFGPNIGWAPCDYYGRPIYVYSYYSYYDYGAWCYSGADYFYSGGGYRTRGVRTSTGRTASGGGAIAGRAVGRNGTHQIRQFDKNTIRQHNAVPVRDARSELTPKHVADAAGRGSIKGVSGNQRKGDFLARAVKDGGVRPEPWSADRNAGRQPFTPKGSDNDRAGFGGDKGGARDSGHRSGEGWGTPGQNTRTNDNNSFGGRGNTGTPSVDRGSNTPPYDRGGSNTPTYDRGGNNAPSGNDRGNNDSSRGSNAPDRTWTPPAQAPRNDPPPRVDPPAKQPPPASNNDRKSTPPPKKDDSNDRKSNDSKPKPRAGWGNPTASADRGSRATDSYTYDRGGSTGSSRGSSAPSYSGSSSGSSRGSSAPSYSGSSSGSSRGSSAPSYSGSSSGSSRGGSYSAPKSSSGGRSSGSQKSSGSSVKSSGGSSKSSSSSKSSGGSSKSSGGSSKSSSSGKRK